MSYRQPSQSRNSLVEISTPGMARKQNRSVASEKAARLAHRSLPWRASW
nr:MAG TPA: hypothetical protein [Caudoviricetes sp.]